MSAHPVDVHVGKRLRLRRTMLGMSQDQLGKKIGVTFQQIQKYERGVNRIGSSRLYDFSKILDTQVSYFFEEFATASQRAEAGFAEEEGNYEAGAMDKQIDNKETLALIRSYYKINDPNIRKKVLGLVKAMGPNEEE